MFTFWHNICTIFRSFPCIYQNSKYNWFYNFLQKTRFQTKTIVFYFSLRSKSKLLSSIRNVQVTQYLLTHHSDIARYMRNFRDLKSVFQPNTSIISIQLRNTSKSALWRTRKSISGKTKFSNVKRHSLEICAAQLQEKCDFITRRIQQSGVKYTGDNCGEIMTTFLNKELGWLRF